MTTKYPNKVFWALIQKHVLVELRQNQFYKVDINHPGYNNIGDALAKGGNNCLDFDICMFVLAFKFTSTNIDRIIFNVITFSLRAEMINGWILILMCAKMDEEAMEFKNTRYHTFISSSMGLYSSILYVVAMKLEPHRYVPILSLDLNKYYVEIFK